MKKFIKEQVLKVVDTLEIIIGILLAVCIAISVVYLIFDIKSIFSNNNLDAFNNYSKNIKGNDSILINNPYAAQIDQHNQILGYDLVLILDELA